GLAERAGFSVIRSDVVRKELAGLFAREPAPSAFGEGIYTPVWTERIYAECRRRAESALFEGKRVLVDATFGDEHNRRAFVAAAAALAAPGVVLLCHAETAAVRDRLSHRQGDVSDANWSVFVRAAERWEGAGPLTQPVLREIRTGRTPEQALTLALEVLRA